MSRAKTFGIYDKHNGGVDTIEATSEKAALEKYFKAHNIPENKRHGYWAEDIYA